MKKAVLTKIVDFNRNVFYVERDRIQIERVKEYGEVVKYAVFDGNGYDRYYPKRLGYILETRVYFDDFGIDWDSATSGSVITKDKNGNEVKFNVYDKNLQNSITEYWPLESK